jgi:hypothetical protein
MPHDKQLKRRVSLSKTQKMLNKKDILQVVTAVSQSHVGHTAVHRLKVRDGYHGAGYKFERFATRLVGASMEAYLAKRPHLDFAHPANKAKKLLYSLPAWREWSTLMPGALALEPIHHPKLKRLPTGRRLDPLSSRIFRHGLDPVGVRTRTLTGGWLAQGYAAERPKQPLIWVSLAGGTAAPTMLMVQAAGINRGTLHYTNIDQDAWAIDVSEEVAETEGLKPDQIKLLVADIFDKAAVQRAIVPGTADVVDLMGIFEYLDRQQSVRLLQLAYELLKPSGIIIACNMRSDHPQLNLHKHGVGWPSVIQKSINELISICQEAGVDSSQLSIYQPLDGVYNVMRIVKPS